VFTMAMHNAMMGDYETENHVVVFELDRAIAWAPARRGAHGAHLHLAPDPTPLYFGGPSHRTHLESSSARYATSVLPST
jgi:hypothetical protein